HRRQRSGRMRLAEVGAVTHGLMRRRVVPDQAGKIAAVAGEPRVPVGVAQYLGPELIEVLVGEERALPDAFAVDEAEAALERGGRRTGFLEKIAVGPVAHRLDGACDPFQL